mgnify:CR=1 FL=1
MKLYKIREVKITEEEAERNNERYAKSFGNTEGLRYYEVEQPEPIKEDEPKEDKKPQRGRPSNNKK